MKTIILFPVFFLTIVFITSCEKSKKEAGCDVNGVWLGHWQIDGGEGGTFITPVNQDETRFDGDIFIRFDLPNLDNYGVDFSGKIINKSVRCMIDISGVSIKVKGDVTNDSIVDGNFDVSLGFSGSYQGKKIDLQPVDVTEIYRISNTFNWYNSIICVNNHIWLPCFSNHDIQVINNDGQIIRNIGDNFLSNAAAYDGSYIWTYDYDSEQGGEKIFKYDTLGNILDRIAVPSYFVDAIAFEGMQLNYADNYNRMVYNVDESGTITDSVPAVFNSMYSFVFKDHEMLFTPGYSSVLYSMDKHGEINGTYILPVENIQSITTNNNGTFWCLCSEYHMTENGPGTSDFIIYKFTLE
jgi:hypothetical protein